MDFQIKPDVSFSISDKKEFNEKKYITDKVLFSALGFNELDSIDYNDFEKCTVMHDLNLDIPKELHNRYDLIYDGGTSEHIFNFPKVLENYYNMLKVGGRIIHALPSSNYVDHGFYMFSPTLFFDYYFANNWKIIDSLFIRHSIKADTKPWSIYKYEPGCLENYSFGGLNKGLYLTFYIAQKMADSTYDASVQQGYYLRTWDNFKNTASHKPLLKRIAERLPKDLKKSLLLLYFKIPLRFSLELIARY